MAQIKPDEDKYEMNLIKQYQYWAVYLYEDQRYLGRAYAWLVRQGEMQDLFDLYPQEEFELFRIGKSYRRAVGNLWKPDMWNHAWLGNEVEAHAGHGHMHLIPRYASTRTFCGIEFNDERWGKNYAPYRKHKLQCAAHGAIRDAIKISLAL
jgi:diadenosine tetraphosphate (Ap4A) HIT family hydrolase